MNESLFGSAAPMWTGSPLPGFGWPAVQGPLSLSGRTGIAASFHSPQFPQTGTTLAGVPGPQTPNALSAAASAPPVSASRRRHPPPRRARTRTTRPATLM